MDAIIPASDEAIVRAYRLMLLSRAIDDKCDELLAQGIPVPNYHGARGQEALYAGVGVALSDSDYLLYNYRAFATLLAKGIPLTGLMGDLLMTSAGTTQGHGGIMHVNLRSKGVVGRNGVFGSKFGIALGLAQEILHRRRHAAVVCMYGEAEGNRGGLYEAINLAALRRLPILFVAENNGYAVASTTESLYSTGDMSGWAAGFPMPVRKVDGNDALRVIGEASSLLGAIRSNPGPAMLECVTLRLDPHHAHDDQTRYRDEASLREAWRGEPISRVEQALARTGWTSQEFDQARADAAQAVAAAADQAHTAPAATLDLVYDYTYYQGASQ